MILYNHNDQYGEYGGGLQQNMMGALSIPMLFPYGGPFYVLKNGDFAMPHGQNGHHFDFDGENDRKFRYEIWWMPVSRASPGLLSSHSCPSSSRRLPGAGSRPN